MKIRAQIRLPGLIQTVLLFVALFPWFSGSAHGLELYGLVDSSCQARTGLIINLDARQVVVLTQEGKGVAIPREAVRNILVYNILSNPIPSVQLEGTTAHLIREVHMGGEKEQRLQGWPIRFVEDLIVFFDTAGNTHFLNVDRILKLFQPESVSGKAVMEEHEPVDFGFGSFLPECEKNGKTGGPKAVSPTRIISDQIRIGKFLSEYQNGFEHLRRFQARAVYYPRPFLYEAETKLGINMSEGRYYYPREFASGFPFYFQWSSGRPYGPQAFFALGAKPVEVLPNLEPLFSLRSEVKAHLFTASFVGNAMSFSQGEDFVIRNRFFYEEYFKRFSEDDLLVVPHFNQMAFTGMDWGAHSFSAGLYFPLYLIQGNRIFREVKSTRASNALRYLYTDRNFRLRMVYSPTRLSSDAPTIEDIRLIGMAEMKEPGLLTETSGLYQQSIESFSLDVRFARVGFDWNPGKEVELGIDEVIILGDYQEVIGGVPYRLEFSQYNTSFRAAQHFGKRVSLRIFLNYFQRGYRSHQESGTARPVNRNFSLNWEIEFAL